MLRQSLTPAAFITREVAYLRIAPAILRSTSAANRAAARPKTRISRSVKDSPEGLSPLSERDALKFSAKLCGILIIFPNYTRLFREREAGYAAAAAAADDIDPETRQRIPHVFSF